MQIVQTKITRKEVHLSPDTRKSLSRLALDSDTALKPFIEAQLAFMGEKAIPYIDLWNQCQALTDKLRELSTK